RKAAFALGASLIAIQFIPVAHPPSVSTRQGRNPARSTGMPEEIANTVQRACGNCHSSSPKWPWYSRVAPASWMIARDVTRARRAMNFSEWQERHMKEPAGAAALLLAACENMRHGSMPPPAYRLMHPESRLNQMHIETYCQWSREQFKRLVRPR
ncbi:MAG: heme-binding domain-containing protein, partial [Bryobacteraceae bacterium]